jgi:hypothetical protein
MVYKASSSTPVELIVSRLSQLVAICPGFVSASSKQLISETSAPGDKYLGSIPPCRYLSLSKVNCLAIISDF